MADISKIKPNGASGTEYEIKDTTARTGVLNLNAVTQSSKTISGNPITVTDAAPINAEDVTVAIEPIQDLHGYDKPWVGGAGKNLLPMTVDIIKSLNTGGTWNNNTYSRYNTDFEILTDSNENVVGVKVTGTPNNDVTLILNFVGTNNTEYILNGCPSGGSSSKYRIDTFGNGVSNAPDYGSGVTFTSSGNSQYVRILINNGYTIPTGGLIFYPMIRLASITDSTFAPYTNICPISGLDSVNVVRVGKNLVDIDNAIDFEKYSGDTRNGFNFTSGIDGTYTISCSSISASVYFAYVNSSNSWIEGELNTSNHSATFTSYGKLQIWVPSGQNIKTIAPDLQVELGTTPTTYEPYQGNTYTISLSQAGTVYSGTLDVTTGKLVVDKVMVDLGDLSWTKTTGGSSNTIYYTPYSGIKKPSSNSQPANILCSVYATASSDNVYYGLVAESISYSTSGNISINTLIYYTDATAFTAAMTGQKLVYELATPQTYTLTPKQIKMLLNNNTVYADCGDITLKYQPDNVVGELKGRDNAIWDAFKANDWSAIYSVVSSSTYQFVFNLYRRGGLVGISSFNFGIWVTCPVGSGEETLPLPIVSKYIPKNKAYFKFRHVSGNGYVVITLQTDGYVEFSWNITVAMTGDEASAGWLLEWNDVQLAKDLFV